MIKITTLFFVKEKIEELAKKHGLFLETELKDRYLEVLNVYSNTNCLQIGISLTIDERSPELKVFMGNYFYARFLSNEVDMRIINVSDDPDADTAKKKMVFSQKPQKFPDIHFSIDEIKKLAHNNKDLFVEAKRPEEDAIFMPRGIVKNAALFIEKLPKIFKRHNILFSYL